MGGHPLPTIPSQYHLMSLVMSWLNIQEWYNRVEQMINSRSWLLKFEVSSSNKSLV
jgi:hypothetical protein